MRLKILLTGNDQQGHESDAEMLKEKGFLVYRCNTTTVNEMIEELHPDVLIINPIDEQPSDVSLYKRILRSIKYARLPLIYTLSEDDVYLVNSKRTSLKERGNFVVDNIIDGIKTALSGNTGRQLKGYKLKVAS